MSKVNVRIYLGIKQEGNRRLSWYLFKYLTLRKCYLYVYVVVSAFLRAFQSFSWSNCSYYLIWLHDSLDYNAL